MAMDAVVGPVEAEAVLQPQPAIGPPADPQPLRMHAVIKQLHAGAPAGFAAEGRGALRGRARRAPERKPRRAQDHQDGQAGHGPSFIDRSTACTCLVSAPMEMKSTPSAATA